MAGPGQTAAAAWSSSCTTLRQRGWLCVAVRHWCPPWPAMANPHAADSRDGVAKGRTLSGAQPRRAPGTARASRRGQGSLERRGRTVRASTRPAQRGGAARRPPCTQRLRKGGNLLCLVDKHNLGSGMMIRSTVQLVLHVFFFVCGVRVEAAASPTHRQPLTGPGWEAAGRHGEFPTTISQQLRHAPHGFPNRVTGEIMVASRASCDPHATRAGPVATTSMRRPSATGTSMCMSATRR